MGPVTPSFFLDFSSPLGFTQALILKWCRKDAFIPQLFREYSQETCSQSRCWLDQNKQKCKTVHRRLNIVKMSILPK